MEFVQRKYKEFINKNGYIPQGFNPYNCQEIDIGVCHLP